MSNTQSSYPIINYDDLDSFHLENSDKQKIFCRIDNNTDKVRKMVFALIHWSPDSFQDFQNTSDNNKLRFQSRFHPVGHTEYTDDQIYLPNIPANIITWEEIPNEVQIKYLNTLKRMNWWDGKKCDFYIPELHNAFHIVQDLMNISIWLNQPINKIWDKLRCMFLYLNWSTQHQDYSLDYLTEFESNIDINNISNEQKKKLNILWSHMNEFTCSVDSYIKML